MHFFFVLLLIPLKHNILFPKKNGMIKHKKNRKINSFMEYRKAEEFFFFFFYGHTHSIWKFLDQGLNPSHSCDLCHSCSNAGSLTHCARPGVEPALPQRQEKIIKPLCHSGNSRKRFFIKPKTGLQ